MDLLLYLIPLRLYTTISQYVRDHVRIRQLYHLSIKRDCINDKGHHHSTLIYQVVCLNKDLKNGWADVEYSKEMEDHTTLLTIFK